PGSQRSNLHPTGRGGNRRAESSISRGRASRRKLVAPYAEPEQEGRALPTRARTRCDRPAEPLHGRMAQRQTEAGPFSGRRGSEEGLEEPVGLPSRKPSPVVYHLEQDVGSLHTATYVDRPRACFARVYEQIHQHLNQVVFV